MLTLRFFGPLEIVSEGIPLPKMRSQTGRWLLALLVLRRSTSLERPALAALLWPDSDEERASFYLRRTLSELRQALGPEADRLKSPTARTLRFDLTEVECDLLQFEAALNSRDFTAAIKLYRGPLLEGCGEEWAVGPRSYYEEQYLSALARAADDAESRGDLSSAIQYLRQVIRTDPAREMAQRNLMRLLSLSGDTAAALQVYRNLRLYLMREGLGTPSGETEAVHQAVRQGTYSQYLAATVKGLTPAPSSANASSTSLPAGNHLPVPLTRMIGRESEQAEISALLQSERLVTITGNGGAGKTRLAIAVAQVCAPTFPQGAHFVDLSALNASHLVAQATAQTLEIPVSPGATPLQTLQKTLSRRSLLIVLDNCEHVLEEAAELTNSLLSTCPQVRFLATSRQSLGVMGEKLYRLPPLTEAAAIALFLERALASAPQGKFPADIGRVCQLLEGIPLAIELAAAWTAYLPLADIEANLQDRLFSPSGNRSLPPRQRTIRTTLDWGYNLLTGEEQRLFTRLSVFAGGWSWEAARTVVEASPSVLAALVDKSLVIFTGERYSFLETVRQYAAERLTEDDERTVRDALMHWCIAIAEDAAPKLSGQDCLRYLALLDSEQDNLRAGLDWSRVHHPTEGLRIAIALTEYWMIRGSIREGLHYFHALLEASHDSLDENRAVAMQQASNLETHAGNYMEADRLLMEAARIYERYNDHSARAAILRNRGNVAHHRGEYVLARRLFEEALFLYQQTGGREGEAQSLENLGYLARQQGNYEQSARLLLQVIALHRKVGNAMGEVSAIGSLGYTRIFQGKLAAAADLFEQALSIHRKTGNRGGIGWNLAGLAEANMAAGNLEKARALLLESLAIHEDMGKRGSMAWNRNHLGKVAHRLGNIEEARAHYREAMLLYREVGHVTEAAKMEQQYKSLILPADEDSL